MGKVYTFGSLFCVGIVYVIGRLCVGLVYDFAKYSVSLSLYFLFVLFFIMILSYTVCFNFKPDEGCHNCLEIAIPISHKFPGMLTLANARIYHDHHRSFGVFSVLLQSVQ